MLVDTVVLVRHMLWCFGHNLSLMVMIVASISVRIGNVHMLGIIG